VYGHTLLNSVEHACTWRLAICFDVFHFNYFSNFSLAFLAIRYSAS